MSLYEISQETVYKCTYINTNNTNNNNGSNKYDSSNDNNTKVNKLMYDINIFSKQILKSFYFWNIGKILLLTGIELLLKKLRKNKQNIISIVKSELNKDISNLKELTLEQINDEIIKIILYSSNKDTFDV